MIPLRAALRPLLGDNRDDLRCVTKLPQSIAIERHVGAGDGLCGDDVALRELGIDEVTQYTTRRSVAEHKKRPPALKNYVTLPVEVERGGSLKQLPVAACRHFRYVADGVSTGFNAKEKGPVSRSRRAQVPPGETPCLCALLRSRHLKLPQRHENEERAEWSGSVVEISPVTPNSGASDNITSRTVATLTKFSVHIRSVAKNAFLRYAHSSSVKRSEPRSTCSIHAVGIY